MRTRAQGPKPEGDEEAEEAGRAAAVQKARLDALTAQLRAFMRKYAHETAAVVAQLEEELRGEGVPARVADAARLMLGAVV